MHMMLQHEPEDFVIATGKSRTVLDFVTEAEKHVSWKADYEIVEAQQRPWDVTELEGNAEAAHEKLGWKPKHTFETLVKDMMEHEPR